MYKFSSIYVALSYLLPRWSNKFQRILSLPNSNLGKESSSFQDKAESGINLFPIHRGRESEERISFNFTTFQAYENKIIKII